MTFQHRELAAGRWLSLPFFEQMANIGSEIERTISWKNKEKPDISRRAFDRALELIDLTVADPKNRSRLREILRVREALVDHFVYENAYHSSDACWQSYFRPFHYAARVTSRRDSAPGKAESH